MDKDTILNNVRDMITKNLLTKQSNQYRWLKLLMKQPDKTIPNMKPSSFKHIFVYKDIAVVVEDARGQNVKLFEKLKRIVQQNNNCLINFPEEFFFVTNNLFPTEIMISKLQYCPKTDLQNELMKINDNLGKENVDTSILSPHQLIKVMHTILILHQNNIFHTDLKPENLFICTCKVDNKEKLVVGDLTDAILLQGENYIPGRNMVMTPHYTPWFAFAKGNRDISKYFGFEKAPGMSKKELEFIDWYQLSMVYTFFSLYKRLIDKNHEDIHGYLFQKLQKYLNGDAGDLPTAMTNGHGINKLYLNTKRYNGRQKWFDEEKDEWLRACLYIIGTEPFMLYDQKIKNTFIDEDGNKGKYGNLKFDTSNFVPMEQLKDLLRNDGSKVKLLMEVESLMKF